MGQNASSWGRGDWIGTASEPSKYKVQEVIKDGGMSHVYRVVDGKLGKQWCYKEIIPEDNTNLVALMSEALIMQKLDNPAIPRIVDIFSTNSPESINDYSARIGIIMDWVDGKSLQTVIKQTGRIDLDLALQWAIQICKIMEYLHKDTREVYQEYVDANGDLQQETYGHAPILYRDLKPLNVMITEKDASVTILDFGISIELEREGELNEVPMGTAGYAPPEAYNRYAPLDLRSDIYTIGATMYHMITGILPPPSVDTKNPDEPMPPIPLLSKSNKMVSPDLDEVVARAMAFNPDDRYQTVTEMRLALERVITLTESKKKEYATHIAITWLFFGLAVFFGVVAMFPWIIMQNNKNTNFEMLVSTAETTHEPEDYKRAIAERPDRVNLYLGLIDAYEQDGVVSEDDLMTLKDYLFPNKDKMVGEDDYGKLCYTLGEMYWYYYDSPLSGTRPEVQAKTWFEEAKKAGYEETKSDVYVKIGEYWTMQSKAVQMSGDKLGDNLKKYWDNLIIAKGFVEGDDELLQYQTYSSIAECLYNYSYQLLQNGVKEEDMRAEIKELQAFLRQVSGSTQMTNKSKQLYADLKAKVPELSDKVDIATRGAK